MMLIDSPWLLVSIFMWGGRDFEEFAKVGISLPMKGFRKYVLYNILRGHLFQSYIVVANLMLQRMVSYVDVLSTFRRGLICCNNDG